MSLLSWNLLFRERAQITRYLESCIRKQSEEGEEGCNSTSEDLKVAGVHRHLGTCTPGQRRGARDARAPGMFGGGPGDRSDGVQQGRRVKQVSQSVTEKGPLCKISPNLGSLKASCFFVDTKYSFAFPRERRQVREQGATGAGERGRAARSPSPTTTPTGGTPHCLLTAQAQVPLSCTCSCLGPSLRLHFLSRKSEGRPRCCDWGCREGGHTNGLFCALPSHLCPPPLLCMLMTRRGVKPVGHWHLPRMRSCWRGLVGAQGGGNPVREQTGKIIRTFKLHSDYKYQKGYEIRRDTGFRWLRECSSPSILRRNSSL